MLPERQATSRPEGNKNIREIEYQTGFAADEFGVGFAKTIIDSQRITVKLGLGSHRSNDLAQKKA